MRELQEVAVSGESSHALVSRDEEELGDAFQDEGGESKMPSASRRGSGRALVAQTQSGRGAEAPTSMQLAGSAPTATQRVVFVGGARLVMRAASLRKLDGSLEQPRQGAPASGSSRREFVPVRPVESDAAGGGTMAL